jgi:hypothetical protein
VPGWLAWLLAAALVAAQALGLAHRVLHGPAPATAQLHAHGHAQARGHGHAHGDAHAHAHARAHAHAHAHAHRRAPGPLHRQSSAPDELDECTLPSSALASAGTLFDDHAPGGEQCRLLDHAVQADWLPAALPPATAAPRGLIKAPPPAAPRSGGSAAGYHARGPPPGVLRQPLLGA